MLLVYARGVGDADESHYARFRSEQDARWNLCDVGTTSYLLPCCSVSPSHPPPEWFRQLSVYATTAFILPPAQVDLDDHTDAAAAHIYASYQQQLRDRRQVSANFPGEGCAIERSSVTPPTKPSSAGHICCVLPWLWLHYLRVSLCREEIAFVVRS